MIVLAGALGAVAGATAGAGARVLVARLRRGARVRPPWCEVVTALLWGASVAAAAAGAVAIAWLPALLALAWLGVAAGAVDLRHHRLPDALTLPAVPVALAALLPLGTDAVLRGLAGAALAFGAHAAVALVSPRAMGAGDVKLAASLGAVSAASTWAAPVLAALLAALFTGLVAAVGLASGRLDRGAAVPHGPSMLLAAWLVVAGAAVAAAAG